MRSQMKQLLAWFTLILSLGLMAGCSNTDEGISGDSSATLSSTGSEKSATESSSADISSESSSSEPSAAEKAGYGAVGALADSEMTIEDMLVYAIQDEHLAHGEYALVLEKFGDQNPFNNIVLSEEQHIAELTAIFEKYGFAIPADESAEHVFVPTTVKEGLENCADGEVDNIAMYNKFLELEIPEDVRMVFTSLRNASEGHLKSFQQNLEKY
ncbi:hypothetical protein SAMN05878443_1014 [Carnobacterium alterfunditum]|uniref:DUF2202 domain-containing protein n=1 Tax=Carnobacterium alterfunditum TaxID=28230 RepID=A0A1N6G483_9LACT|nr:DUF2202 domain-containing protein [Carnobacterium alterfunditum]SIO02323.1 hypothetical protein SAMN05878443_1014 [Carnobacterium alterfunditum]